MSSISVILPAYEEANNLQKLLPLIHSCLQKEQYDYEILVLDAMTPTGDGTSDICAQENAIYVPREGGNHYGDAIRTGIRLSCKERIAVMDADGSHNPADLVRMMETMNRTQCDIVIGSRYVKGGNTENIWILRVMSYIVNVAYRLIFHINVKDVSDSFRLYYSEQLKAIQLHSNNFDLVEEILVVMQIRNPQLHIVEMPISFSKRDEGKSKRNLLHFAFTYCTTINHLLRIKQQARKEVQK